MDKISRGLEIAKKDGPIRLIITALDRIDRRSSADSRRNHNPIYTQVKYQDALIADYRKRPPKWKGSNGQKLRFNWIMPPPGKGSGGHKVIFKAIKNLEDAGHTCRIYFYGVFGNSPINEIRAGMGDSYDDVKANMEWIETPNDMKPADGLIATSWETAYPVFNSTDNARRFYFVLDYEPFFFPVGGLYTLAENTYKMGLECITGGDWIAKKLKNDYGIEAASFEFGSDEKIYKYNGKPKKKEILYYCRPYTARRGFEIAIMALDLFHKKHPDYKINLFGHDVSEYYIPFPYNNLKTLELNELNELYNRCIAGLVMSFTNMSLLPPELLMCGVIPVVNKGDNNRLVFDSPYIAYSEPNPVALAERLSEVVTAKNVDKRASEASNSIKTNIWGEAGEKIVEFFESKTRNPE